ncbi:hypothetical protein M378DRAFT_211878 [Amanita muscaria Koide BX008]|uniref:ELP3-like N-terminal domain-containing protein n=1 Tax=Amanita muscaria (strain Koide BX008) TaxID=946122 RepID=A0A0C2XQ63_AMAMK|nr:hypothetical protein M378DRAFT_211878 [Amanita muscaria Koide BX008]
MRGWFNYRFVAENQLKQDTNGAGDILKNPIALPLSSFLEHHQVRARISKKYSDIPRLVDIVSAIPDEYKKLYCPS